MNGSCKFCDPVYRQLTCCADTPNSAGQPFSCSNPPFASVATSKRADLVLYRSRRILTPSCEGGLVAMALMAKARHLMGPTVQRHLLVGILLLNSGISGQGQEPTRSLGRLEVDKTIPIGNEFARPLMVPVKCDASGSVYLRGYQFPTPLAAPVIKVRPDGRVQGEFRASEPDFRDAAVMDFGVLPDGNIVELASTVGGVYTLLFDQDGKFRSSAKLATPEGFLPRELGLFSPTRFLVAGTITKEDVVIRPFAGIFDDSGQLIRELKKVQTDRPTAASPRRIIQVDRIVPDVCLPIW